MEAIGIIVLAIAIVVIVWVVAALNGYSQYHRGFHSGYSYGWEDRGRVPEGKSTWASPLLNSQYYKPHQRIKEEAQP